MHPGEFLPILDHSHINQVEGIFAIWTQDLGTVVEVVPGGDRFVEYSFEDLQWLRGLGLVRTRAPRLHDAIWGDRVASYLAGKRLILFDFESGNDATSRIHYRVA